MFKILPGGVLRAVHVLASSLKDRLADGKPRRMIVVRDMAKPERAYTFWRVEILGPASIGELPSALPGTEGRGICPLLTDAPLRVWTRNPGVTCGLLSEQRHKSNRGQSVGTG